eukprot:2949666-Rhodomonas_salina.2
MSGTDRAYAGWLLPMRFPRNVRYCDSGCFAIGLGACYAMSGTEIAYAGGSVEVLGESRALRRRAGSPYPS